MRVLLVTIGYNLPGATTRLLDSARQGCRSELTFLVISHSQFADKIEELESLAQRPDVCVEIHAGRMIENQGGSVAEVLSYFPESDYELLVNTSPNDNETRFGPLTQAITGRCTLLALPIGKV